MKERSLTTHVDDRKELVCLTPRKLNEAIKDAQNLALCASEIYKYLKDGKFEIGYSNTVLSLIETYVKKIHEIFNYESKLREEYEKRHIEIRALNIENRELRRQLGEKVSAEDVREKLKNYAEVIRKWWKEDGLGYVAEMTFHGYCCEISLNGSMSCDFEMEQVQKLRDKGYILDSEEGSRSFFLKHSDSNVELLIAEVKKRFPSATLTSIETVNWSRGGLQIRTAKFHIKDFGDF